MTQDKREYHQTVFLEDILAPETCPYRTKLDKNTVERYERAYSLGTEMPPLRVAKINNALRLYDGFHRLAALTNIGAPRTKVCIVEGLDPQGLGWQGAALNMQHGKPLTGQDRIRAFKVYMEAGQNRKERNALKSYREIAEDFQGHLRTTTLHRWMHKFYPKIANRMSKGKGAMKEHPAIDHEQGVLKEGIAYIGQTMAAYNYLQNEDKRGAMVAAMEQNLKDMKAGGGFRYPEIDEDDF